MTYKIVEVKPQNLSHIAIPKQKKGKKKQRTAFAKDIKRRRIFGFLPFVSTHLEELS